MWITKTWSMCWMCCSNSTSPKSGWRPQKLSRLKFYMKQYYSTALTIVCVVVVVLFIFIKRSDDAQHEADAAAITTFSNQLASAQEQLVSRDETVLMYSNNLAGTRSTLSTISNQLVEAKSIAATYVEQITNLNTRIAKSESENLILNQQIATLTNQTAELTKQVALTDASVEQAHKEYSLLENCLRRDMAERIIVERKFNNLSELQLQLE